MRLVVQRVKSGSVTVDGTVVSSIGPGIVALVGLHQDDTPMDLEYCSQHLLNVKLWENANKAPWRQSVKQRHYELLLVSQFTLYATLNKKKYQPDYKWAMKSIPAAELYAEFVAMVQTKYGFPERVQNGVFGAMMDVALVNDGPVTLVIDSRTTSTASTTTPTTDTTTTTTTTAKEDDASKTTDPPPAATT